MTTRTTASKEITRDIAPAAEASRHFAAKLTFETDCWDVSEAIRSGATDVAVLDVRSASAYEASHVPGSISVPRREITRERLESISSNGVFVVYCAGPHCNGADKAALHISQLGRQVKIMIGGHHGWEVEGLGFEVSAIN